MAATRRELALATGSFAAATSALATTEDSNNLSKALSNLAIVEEKVEKVQHRQADADHLHLFELFKDYVGLMGAVRDALTERQKAFQVGSLFLIIALICFDFVTKREAERCLTQLGGVHKLCLQEEGGLSLIHISEPTRPY